MRKQREAAPAEEKPPWAEFPRTTGACVDRLYKLDQQRAEAQRKVDALKTEYDALERHLIDALPKSELDGAIGKLATAKLITSTVPTVEDWTKLRAYIVREKAWDLLQKRTSAPAFRERWADKKAIPGVSVFNVIKLSVTKRGT